MESYDIIIVGAGPGGLSAAAALAKSDKNVLLLEKNRMIGPKICAGGLRGSDFEYLKLPGDLRGSQVDKLGYLTVDRKELGQSQLKKLDKKRIAIRTGAKVTKIEQESVVVNDRNKIRYKYLVGADGSLSTVRKYLGLKEKRALVGIQYIIPVKEFISAGDSKRIQYYYNQRLFLSWFAWVFPHKDYLAIGCGADRKLLPVKKLKENFREWLTETGIDVSGKKLTGFPINCDYRGHKFNNIFLVGDAAGLASYQTGEGIHQALVSGEEVAKMLIDPGYKSKKFEKFLRS